MTKQELEEKYTQNIGLVYSTLRHVWRPSSGLPYEDAFQEASLALLAAIKGYKKDNGNNFSTYARNCIKNSLTTAITEAKAVRIPSSIFRKKVIIAKAIDEFNKTVGRKPTISEIGTMLKGVLTNAEISSAISVSPENVISLDKEEETNEGDKTPFGCSIPSKDAGPDERYVEKEKAQLVEKLFSFITKKEQLVVGWYFGLDQQGPRTLKDIQQLLRLNGYTEITVQAIGYLKDHALQKIKRSLSSELLDLIREEVE